MARDRVYKLMGASLADGGLVLTFARVPQVPGNKVTVTVAVTIPLDAVAEKFADVMKRSEEE